MPAPKGNKYLLGYSGKKPKYETPDELADKIIAYFDYCNGEYKTEMVKATRKRKDEATGKMKMVEVDEEKTTCIREPERPMVTRLALFLGFESRQSIHDYVKREAYSYASKRALMTIESIYEEMLIEAKGGGVIFALKNMGWEDRSTLDNNVNVKAKPSWLTGVADKDGIKKTDE